MVLNGNFHTTNQWEDQELDGRMWFRRVHSVEDKRMEEKSCK
jgi:hypothetical protein